jgi:hypothetical protein
LTPTAMSYPLYGIKPWPQWKAPYLDGLQYGCSK